MTLGEAKQYASDNMAEGKLPKDARVFLRCIEEALRRLADERLWNAYQQRHRLNLSDVYNTGTVSIAGDRITLTGVGTTFTTAHEQQLFRVDGDNITHEIETRTNGTTIVLKDQYQKPGATTFSAGSTYEIFNYSYDLPWDEANGDPVTRLVESVVLQDRLEELTKVGEADIRRMWADLPQSQRPEFYAVVSAVEQSDGTERQRLLLYPAPDDTHVIDVILHRYPFSPTATTLADTDPIDVPRPLEEYFKSVLLYRLAHADVAWAKKMQVAISDMRANLELAKRQDAKYSAAISIGPRGRSHYGKSWNYRIS